MSEVADHVADEIDRLEAIEREVRRIPCPHGVIPDWLEADGLVHVRVDCELCSHAPPETYRSLLGPIPRVAFSLPDAPRQGDAFRAPESVVPTSPLARPREGGDDAAQTLAGGSVTPVVAASRTPPREPAWSFAISAARAQSEGIPAIEAADAKRDERSAQIVADCFTKSLACIKGDHGKCLGALVGTAERCACLCGHYRNPGEVRVSRGDGTLETRPAISPSAAQIAEGRTGL